MNLRFLSGRIFTLGFFLTFGMASLLVAQSTTESPTPGVSLSTKAIPSYTAPAKPTPAPSAPSAETGEFKGPDGPPSPPVPVQLILPPPGGPVEEFVGHRKIDSDGSGWGWIRKPNEDWHRARWIAMRETPSKIAAPWRELGRKDADNDFEYKIWGYFANHQVYDPIMDEMIDAFVLDHYEALGPAKPLSRKPGPRDRFTYHSHASRASSRENRPVQSQRDDN